MQYLTPLVMLSFAACHLAYVIRQNPKLATMDDGFLELQSNGSVILRGTGLINYSNVWQEAVIIKTIMNALRLMPLQAKNILKDLNQKIYGDGVEHKFPPFLERVIQRIQTYFSIYKYTDTIEPVRQDKKSTSTTTPAAIAASAQKEIDLHLTTAISSGLNKRNKTWSNVDELKIPLTSITSNDSTTTPHNGTVVSDEDEENEFIEIKKYKRV